MAEHDLRRSNMTKQHQHHHPVQPNIHRSIDLAALYAANSGPTLIGEPDRRPEEIHVTIEARETTWAITENTSVDAWGYNGRVPGPLLVARAGDTLVVHLINKLPEPTLIHWHGLRLASSMDRCRRARCRRAVRPLPAVWTACRRP
jgi:hypothetical protein